MGDQIITRQKDLDRLCGDLRDCSWIALDTEFMRVRTYFPRLCLLQIAYDDGAVGIDPLASDLSLDTLWDTIADPSAIKILHAARQDLEVIYQTSGRGPLPLFDTQIAAAFLGYGDQVGYASLVSTVMAVDLAKSHTRTDWCKRPLTTHQVEYALDDVRYLGAIYHRFDQELNDRGRTEWMREECAQFADTELYDPKPAFAYEKFGRGHVLAPASQQLLKALAVWRENVARKLNRPRGWILEDKLLMLIARACPSDATQLQSTDGLPPAFARQHGASVLEIANNILQSTHGHSVVWPAQNKLNPQQRILCKRIATLFSQTGEREQIASSLLGSRHDIERMVRGRRDTPQFIGWRGELLAAGIGAVLDARDDEISAI